MSRPRITAYIWQCNACSLEQFFPLSREPLPAAIQRARTAAAARVRCADPACRGRGDLAVFWSNDWTGDQTARQGAHIARKLAARLQARTCKKPDKMS